MICLEYKRYVNKSSVYTYIRYMYKCICILYIFCNSCPMFCGNDHPCADVVPNSFTYGALLTACEKAWSVALQSLEELPRCRMMPETILCNAALGACGKAGWRTTTMLLDHMHASSLQRSDVSFNAVLGFFGSLEFGSLWRSGQALFHFMRAEGIKPNLISINSLMTSFEKNREWRRAQAFLAEGVDCHGFEEDAVTLNALLSAYEKGYRWAQAQWQLACMVARQMVSAVTLGACISAYGVATEWERAVDVHRDVLSYRIEANSVMCGAALSACARGNCWKLAFSLAETDTHLGPVELNSALTACSSSHVTDRALMLARQMARRRVQMDLVTCNAVLSICGHEGLWFESIELLKSRSNMGLDFGGIQPDVLSFSAALSSCAAAGRPAEAMKLLVDATASQVILDTAAMTNAVAACQRKYLWQQVLQLVQPERSDAVLLQFSLDSADIAGCHFAGAGVLDVIASRGAEALGSLRGSRIERKVGYGWYGLL